MPFQFHSVSSPEYEAVCAIHMLLRQSAPQDLLQKHADSSHIAWAERLLGPLTPLYALVRSHCDLAQPWLVSLFAGKSYYSAGGTLAFKMVAPYLPRPGRSMREGYLALSPREQARQAARALLSLLDGYDCEAAALPQDAAEFFQVLDTLGLPSEAKFDLLRSFHSYEDTLLQFSQLLETLAELLAAPLQALWDVYAKPLVDLEDSCTGDPAGLSEISGQRLQILPGETLLIYPVLLSLCVDFFAEADSAALQSRLMWGVTTPELVLLLNSFQAETGPDILRAILEKTKFEILRTLCDRPMYGGELAAKLGITSATVSHHISDLLNFGLICASPDRRRMYYSVNRDKVIALLDEVRCVFE